MHGIQSGAREGASSFGRRRRYASMKTRWCAMQGRIGFFNLRSLDRLGGRDFRNALLPVSGNPHPPAGTALPLAFNPDRRCSRTLNPAAGYPYVICSSPAPVPACPDIPWSGRNGLLFNLNGWRRSCHGHFSTDHPVSLRLDDFSPDFRGRCSHNGFSFAAGE